MVPLGRPAPGESALIAAKKGRDWARRYPPLTVVVIALALSILALPSALNLPQANPGQTLEYAPVPGDQGQANAGGNFAGLGLGSSGGVAPGSSSNGAGNGDASGVPPPQDLVNQSSQPSQFQCVGSPPRQTEDPLSPPCVAFYKGDNGGATTLGVTRTEIRVVVRYLELQGGCHSGVVAPNTCGAPSGIYDMDKPSDYNQYFLWVDLHNWEVYFNKHYQMYGRYLHFYAANYGDTQDYVQSGYPATKATTQAADAWTQLHPFADVSHVGLFDKEYTSYFAQHQSQTFGTLIQQLASSYPGQFWSYSPPQEYTAREYATYVCTRVVKPGKVTFSGDNNLGADRKYGLLLTDDPHAADTQRVQKLAVQDMKDQCGLTPTYTAYFHYSGAFNFTGPNSGYGTQNMATMKGKGVTTILWPGGEESEDMTAADKLKYYPEWVLLGDGLTDGNLMSNQASSEITNAWVVTAQTLQNAGGQPVEPACLDALLEVNPGISRQGGDISLACTGPYGFLYDDLRQLATGVQLSGPQLTAHGMDQGFHAIPPKPSPGPSQAACYYNTGDYTCVKDAAAEWFDINTPQSSTDSSGCWRMWRGGARYLPGAWPQGDVKEGKSLQTDICNLVAGGLGYGLRPSG